ncbi:hypothetical protein [Lentzea pudingi]|nr:hypothetical protein [Lentzea pudingi]
MASSEGERPRRALSTYKAVFIAIGAAIVGLGLLWLAGSVDAIKGNPGLQSVFNNLGSALITGMALVVLWELVSKRSFAREVIEVTRSAADIERSGITHAGTEYLRDADWDGLFSRVQKLDIFFAYGHTWRGSNLTNLRALARKKGCRIRVYLPDVEDSDTVRQLATRIKGTPEKMIDLIVEARSHFESLYEPGGAEISVFYRPGELLFSAYRFDSTAVITLFAHRKERGGVPTIVCQEPGTLYSFIKLDLDAVNRQSRQVFPQPVVVGNADS